MTGIASPEFVCVECGFALSGGAATAVWVRTWTHVPTDQIGNVRVEGPEAVLHAGCYANAARDKYSPL